jgi:hypothetical protein
MSSADNASQTPMPRSRATVTDEVASQVAIDWMAVSTFESVMLATPP